MIIFSITIIIIDTIPIKNNLKNQRRFIQYPFIWGWHFESYLFALSTLKDH